ncbi:hypothetical protein CYFUS_008878 [Cystobacter fuscus]|uniref:Uncharacterized protein n=1 Tax=Cystobacter fuscus TaxID=43 RepID=A0A250JIH3_9BACT|nr:hypothetical protein [Cystobacter fuscus]ATB43398.1 hypothetical protein CYFUS_008878 [Cystobacter fuscus]
MKVMEGYDASEDDSLRLDFKGSFDSQAARQSELEVFLQVLEAHAGEWMPDVVKGKRQREYTRDAVLRALEERGSQRYTHCGLYHARWPAVDMLLGLYLPPLLPMLDVVVKVKALSFFAKEERCLHIVEMVRAWACRYPVTHARAHSADDAELAGSPRFGRDEKTSRQNGFDKVYEVFWLNVFGPKLVETVGRERMLSTPAHRVEELPNGSILLVTWPTVADFASKEARLAQARAHAHLRPDLDFDTVLRTLHERSARLTPVEPRFHPDMATLLSRVVDRAASHERQQRIAELNAWQPAEPEEWRPANSALPPDVENVERALQQYSLYAEHLVALLHSQVPSVFKATPESLTDADFYFWREEFPKRRLREVIDEHAVPAIGAYLGEVLVRNLGGRWIPRQKLEEAQVLVGNRVWLPFLRARRYMASRQALLDHSLTQLYRAAERHQS